MVQQGYATGMIQQDAKDDEKEKNERTEKEGSSSEVAVFRRRPLLFRPLIASC